MRIFSNPSSTGEKNVWLVLFGLSSAVCGYAIASLTFWDGLSSGFSGQSTTASYAILAGAVIVAGASLAKLWAGDDT